MNKIKNSANAKCWQECKETGSNSAGGNITCSNLSEHEYGPFFHQTKHMLTTWPSNCPLGHLPEMKTLCSHKKPVHKCLERFIYTSPNFKQPKYPSVGEWFNKLWYYLAIKRMSHWYIQQFRWIARGSCYMKERQSQNVTSMWFTEHSWNYKP